MNTVLTIIGILIIGMCVWGMVTPRVLMDAVSGIMDRPSGIYFAIAGRIAMGLIFILAAFGTRYPDVILVLGYLMIAAAVLLAFLGRKRLKKFIQWWMNKSPAFARAWLLLGALFGAFLIHAAN